MHREPSVDADIYYHNRAAILAHWIAEIEQRGPQHPWFNVYPQQRAYNRLRGMLVDVQQLLQVR